MLEGFLGFFSAENYFCNMNISSLYQLNSKNYHLKYEKRQWSEVLAVKLEQCRSIAICVWINCEIKFSIGITSKTLESW